MQFGLSAWHAPCPCATAVDACSGPTLRRSRFARRRQVPPSWSSLPPSHESRPPLRAVPSRAADPGQSSASASLCVVGLLVYAERRAMPMPTSTRIDSRSSRARVMPCGQMSLGTAKPFRSVPPPPLPFAPRSDRRLTPPSSPPATLVLLPVARLIDMTLWRTRLRRLVLLGGWRPAAVELVALATPAAGRRRRLFAVELARSTASRAERRHPAAGRLASLCSKIADHLRRRNRVTPIMSRIHAGKARSTSGNSTDDALDQSCRYSQD